MKRFWILDHLDCSLKVLSNLLWAFLHLSWHFTDKMINCENNNYDWTMDTVSPSFRANLLVRKNNHLKNAACPLGSGKLLTKPINSSELQLSGSHRPFWVQNLWQNTVRTEKALQNMKTLKEYFTNRGRLRFRSLLSCSYSYQFKTNQTRNKL